MSRILILTVQHGASHNRVSAALLNALRGETPEASAEVVDALEHCAPWFRTYYDSYRIPLRHWPWLWEIIEKAQHTRPSTGPLWLYRLGGKRLWRFIEERSPDVVVATEVGMCEIAALHKREKQAHYILVGVPTGLDADRAWAQPEVDLFAVSTPDTAARLEAAGVSHNQILVAGQPVDLTFEFLPDPATARGRLGVPAGLPLVLVLFGGAGHGNPEEIVRAFQGFDGNLQFVFIAGKNPRVEAAARRACRLLSHSRVLGWVDNIHEWMAAADMLVSKPGATTLIEALNSGLPMIAFSPLPGNERRACDWIERNAVGYWARRVEDLAPTLERMLNHGGELQRLKKNAAAYARPGAAREVARAILERSRQASPEPVQAT